MLGPTTWDPDANVALIERLLAEWSRGREHSRTGSPMNRFTHLRPFPPARPNRLRYFLPARLSVEPVVRVARRHGHRLPPLLLTFLLASCGGDATRRAAYAPEVDTLASGAVRVRNTSTGAWDADPAARWRLTEIVRIGRLDGVGPDVFGMVGSLVEDALGRLWIADSRAGEIRVFDREGQYVRTVGRPGGGPGEFSSLGVVIGAPNGTIWVDAGGRRWEVFDTAGVRIAGHPVNSNFGRGVRYWTTDGRLLEVNLLMDRGGTGPFGGITAYVVRRLGPNGELTPEDTLLAPVLPEPQRVNFTNPEGRTTIVRNLPLTRDPTFVVRPDGTLWITEGGNEYRIRRQTFEGDTLMLIERSFEPIAASDSARRLARDEMQPPEGLASRDNDPGRIPAVYPPFNALYSSRDGTLWVRRDLEDDAVGLDVFDPTGAYLGQVDAPADLAGLSIRLITEDRIYAVAKDDFDVQYVVYLRIERPREDG